MVHAFKWLSNFLLSPNLDEDFSNLDFSTKFAIHVQSGRFTWSPDRPPALKNVNLEVSVGQLAVVIGSSHSGKSSLLNCLLREMIRLRGKIATMGRITYVSQNPWLRNGTIRDNILFGHPPNDFFYDEVVKACHLTQVFQKFEKRDLTLIQSKLLTLDRKIQQQICLARALFTNADIYLLDNILQDFDILTATNIFRDVIGPNGLLGKKTRLLVSSSSTFVKEADVVIQVNNGRVTSNKHKNLDVDQEEEDSYFSLEPESSDQQTDFDYIGNDKSVKTTGYFGKKPSVVMSCIYFCFENNGCLGPLVTMLLFSALHGLSLGFQVFIRSYIDSPMPLLTTPFQSIFAGGSLIYFIVTILSGINQKNFFSAAANKWHERMIATLLRLPRFTFGLLLRRYPTRQLAVDLLTATEIFAPAIHQVVNNTTIALTLVLIICICITPFWFILPITIFLFICIQIYYCKIHRIITHKCIQARQPILDHFGETVHGLETIRAFQRQHEFHSELENFLDASHTAHTFFVIGARWLVIRTDSLTYLIIAVIGIIGTASSISSSSIGLAFISAIGLSHILRELILVGCDIQKNSCAITRLHDIMQLPLEPPWRSLYRPGVRWPETGTISFRGFVCCRPKSLHLLLRGITCDIMPEEKVGIIGNLDEVSAVGLVLLRLIDGMTGTIFIDGIDINQIGLYDLRSRLTVITKDVMYLMPGSLWRNLDPQKQHLVEDVQLTVRMSRLQSFVSSLQRGLMHEIDNDDPNLTDEIRLQICLARALLRKSKILIIDLDMIMKFPRLHQLVKATLRCAFAQSTILYLTTNYEMVEDCDRIMILESGSIKAFDIPSIVMPA